MKTYRFTLPRRNAISACYALALVTASACFTSCQDETESSSRSSQVFFTPEISASWNSLSRTGSDVPHATVTALEGGSKPLYLHASYADSIAFTPPRKAYKQL